MISDMLNFDKGDGLLPVVVQDYKTKEILMLGYTNKEAFEKSVQTKKAWYYSRSRNKLWMKGESSGHVQNIKEILVDCDEDSIVFIVEQVGGAACHTGYNSCFYRKVEDNNLKIFKDAKIFDPKEIYKK